MERCHRHQLVAAIPDHPDRSLVHVRVLQAHRVEDEDAVVAGVEREQHPVKMVLGSDSVGDVANRRHDEHVAVTPQRLQADLDWEHGAVRSSGFQ